MNTRISALSALLSFLFVSAFIVWLFSLHGTIGLFRSELAFQIATVGLMLLGILPPGLLVIGRSRRKANATGWRFIPVIVLSALGIAVAVLGFAYLNGAPFSPVGDIPPHLLISGSTGSRGIPDIAVVAYSRDHERKALTWGKAGSQDVIEEQVSTQQHVFMLRGLEPGTEYWYRLGNGFTYRFSTPRPEATLRFAVGSDAHFGAGDNRKDLTVGMLDHIADPFSQFDYFFSLGDLVELGFRDELWKEAFRTLSPTMSRIPTGFVAGNHDTLFTGLRRYLRFGYPSAVDLDSGNRLWWRFDVGDIHFIILDFESSGDTFSVEQASWLEEQLECIPAEHWTIVLSHRYYYSSSLGGYLGKLYDDAAAVSRVTPLFEQYDVDVVFSGHDHHMELLEKSGVMYVVAGAFGGTPDRRPASVSSESVWYAAEDFGYVDVAVGDTETLIMFRNAAGEELKSAVVAR